MNPMDRFMMETFKEPGKYSRLKQALESPAMWNLNIVLLIWEGFEIALALLHYVLERFTLEEHERAQHESEKMRERLGDAQIDNKANDSFLATLANGRPLRYVMWGAMIFSVIGLLDQLVTDVLEDTAPNREYRSPKITKADLASVNPYRDLLPEQDPVLRERTLQIILFYVALLILLVVYMSHILRQLTPTTLPEDDYQLFSNMIRSLETRTDLSWRVYEETDIRETISSAANRGRGARNPIAEEPFSIKKRVKALSRHWHHLAIAPRKPERWEDASDTTFMPPLIATHSFGEGATKLVGQTDTANAQDEVRWMAGGFKLVLTSEQEAEATRIYNKWRRKRDHKVSYLKNHPPTPIAWVPLAKSSTGIRNAWDTLFEDGRVEAGRRVSTSKLSVSKQWKPIFGPLYSESIPFGWVPPGEEPQTTEDIGADLEAMYQESDRRAERRTKQEEYIRQLKASIEEQEGKKEL